MTEDRSLRLAALALALWSALVSAQAKDGVAKPTDVERQGGAEKKREESIEALMRRLPTMEDGESKADLLVQLAELYAEKSQSLYRKGERRESNLYRSEALRIYETILREYPAYMRRGEVVKRKDDVRRREREQVEAEALMKEQQDDDEDWTSTNARDCQTPAKAEACDGVAAYLAKRPDGRHAREALALIEKVQEQIDALVEARDWEAAEVAKCLSPVGPLDCDGVSEYLTAHPKGLHFTAAETALRSSSKKVASLKKKEEVRQLQEQRAKEKAEAEAVGLETRERYLAAKKTLLAKRGGAGFVKQGEDGFRTVAAIVAELKRVEAKFQGECPEQACKTGARLQWYAGTFERLRMRQQQATSSLGAVGNSAVYAGCGSEFSDFYVAGLECFAPNVAGTPGPCK